MKKFLFIINIIFIVTAFFSMQCSVDVYTSAGTNDNPRTDIGADTNTDTPTPTPTPDPGPYGDGMYVIQSL